ncbi:MAG TPA: hypothetical protein VN040_24855 [Pseudosphingobacterium sp.]|nr:hypothetical protein [Pseudosphingobacterium sp.]
MKTPQTVPVALLVKEGDQTDFENGEMTDFSSHVNNIHGLTYENNRVTLPTGIYNVNLTLWMSRDTDYDIESPYIKLSYALDSKRARTFSTYADRRKGFSHHRLEANFVLNIEEDSFDFPLTLFMMNGQGKIAIYGGTREGNEPLSYLLITKLL